MNNKYSGENSIAITLWNGIYQAALAGSPCGMDDTLEGFRGMFGDDFSVPFRYDGVNSDALDLISEAVENLKKGKKVDLEHLLD